MGLPWLKGDPQKPAGIHLPPQPGAPGLTGRVPAGIVGLLQEQARLLAPTVSPGTQRPCSAGAWVVRPPWKPGPARAPCTLPHGSRRQAQVRGSPGSMVLLPPSPGSSGAFSISRGSSSGLPALPRHSQGPIWDPSLHGVPSEAVSPQSCPGLSVIHGVGTDPSVACPPPRHRSPAVGRGQWGWGR